MHLDEFQKELRREFDDKVFVKQDPSDHCFVVWDHTRSGVPYPVYKVACNTIRPHERGQYREAYMPDIYRLRRMDFASKYNQRKGAAAEIMEEIYHAPRRREEEMAMKAIEETTRFGVRPYVEWRTGVRNSISMAPIGARGGAGGMKNRHHDWIRRGLKVQENALKRGARGHIQVGEYLE